MEILVREIKIKSATRLLPSSHFYLSSSRVFSSNSSSTTPIAPSPFSSSFTAEDSPLWKIIKSMPDPKASVVPVLDRWIKEGNTVKRPFLRSLISFLERDKRYNHALEISHWMTISQNFTLSPTDAAIRESLFQRTSGLEHAKASYINSSSDDLRTYNDYVTLLCCYVQEKSVQKAEAIVQEMREKKMLKSAHPYNLLSRLYSLNKDFQKIDILMEEMKINGINPDKYTMTNWMQAAVATSNISGIEKVLDQLNKDPRLVEGWRTYSMAANWYLKARLFEQALPMLRKMEEMMPLGRNAMAFDFLLTQYAKTCKKDEIFRVWDMYKTLVEPIDKSYGRMIQCLLELQDIEGAEQILKEWEFRCTNYEFQVQTILRVTHYKKAIFKKAEAAVRVEGVTHHAGTWHVLARGYAEQNQMSKAVEMLKRALSAATKGWKPNPTLLNSCLNYLEVQGDVQAMEELIKSLKSLELSTRDMYHQLVRTCVWTGKLEDLDQTTIDDFPDDEEINEILEKPSA